MDTTMSEVVQFIQENDVKFIRLAFCDIFGNQKNIAIMPTELVVIIQRNQFFIKTYDISSTKRDSVR